MLEIDRDSSDPSCCTFVITSPKLEMLSCFDFNDIHLTYWNTITHLETKLYTEKFHALKNLQFLQVDYGFPIEIIRPKIFSIFPKLETFACSPNVCRTSYKNLIKEKHRLQRPGLRIYFQSVELDDIKKIREYKQTVDEFVFQIKNYNKLAEIAACYFAVSYNELMDLMGNKIPDDFYKKYFNARHITVATKVENPEHLFGFLKNFDYLTILYLCSDSLDQTFFNGLVVLDQLTELIINNSKSIFNFDFILKLKGLKNFRTNTDSPKHFDLMLALFKHLKYFCSIKFVFEERNLLITKNKATNDYKIVSFAYEKNELDFNGLIREVDALRRQHIDQD
ncbi:uncharacterized protein LOC119085485 [Bradysia coprophila]|uniref:uncharacterized protein LOC119085485 n=1 Tax=Bradysia coprophila TaxID=38358 RepID=UPI00187D9B07|nr:uncharacterized protein LOC119085485 [Bradysia coprophila]